MRVLMLTWEYPPVVVGGLGRHATALATGLVRAGHDVTVVTRHTAGAALEETLDGVRVVRAPEDPPLLPFSDLLAWTMALGHSLARAALREGARAQAAGAAPFDVVHAHDWLVAHPATTLKDAWGVPLVATLHATEAGRHQGWLPEPLNRAIHSVEWWLTFEARRVVTCSSHMRWEVTRLFDLPPEKVEVIPNGVDAPAWRVGRSAATRGGSAYAGDGPLVVVAARLVYEKGVQTALEALPRLRRRHPGLRLVVAGTGPHDADLRALARRLRLGRSLTMAGFLDAAELAALFAAADVTVVPSVYEPFGLVALEAAAAGTPLVVSDVGGLREIVEPGVTGLRVPPLEPGALAAAVDTLLGDEVLARRLARAARAVVAERYDWTAVARATAATYARAVTEERALQAGAVARPTGPLRMVVRDGNLLHGTGDGTA